MSPRGLQPGRESGTGRRYPAGIPRCIYRGGGRDRHRLASLVETWSADPQANQVLRDIRRHFHTFKGNGRAVGANILRELGWAAQDMLDRVLDGDLELDAGVQDLVRDVTRLQPSWSNPIAAPASWTR